ncbi:MAG: hypothetical protein VYB08_05865 [Candidatus Latescibacterota bacterium]|nr:hypothetical protein [Candidatus Latescibacterota bacterium]
MKASWVQTGGMSGFEITGSEGTIFEHPDKGMLVTAPVRMQPGSPRRSTTDDGGSTRGGDSG